MTLSRDALCRVAALIGAAPDVSARLVTASGASLDIASHPHGTMCANGFRHLMAAWEDDSEPLVDEVVFTGAHFAGGVLATLEERYFTTTLSAQETAECLRCRSDWPERAHAVVREDSLLNLSVVIVCSSDMGAEALDEAAMLAHAGCLVEELCRDAAGA